VFLSKYRRRKYKIFFFGNYRNFYSYVNSLKNLRGTYPNAPYLATPLGVVDNGLKTGVSWVLV